jgi:hypothetical protein
MIVWRGVLLVAPQGVSPLVFKVS